ncbi:MAG TPA: hypothetical protein DEO33_04280 [Rikenellaceae bacterium]|nr:hypothetical protein [Rikenellaceae bacterium]
MQEGVRAIGDTETLQKIVSPRTEISLRRQCKLLGLNRSNLYYKPVGVNPEDLDLMDKMDKENTPRMTF